MDKNSKLTTVTTNNEPSSILGSLNNPDYTSTTGDSYTSITGTYPINPDYIFSSTDYGAIHGINYDQIYDVRIGDEETMRERLDRIEKIVGLAPRKPGLEAEYPDLAKLGDHIDESIGEIYKEMTKHIEKATKAYEDFAEQCLIMQKLKSDNGD